MKKIIITGHLGKDPEKRTTPEGSEFVTFTVAVNSGTKQNAKTDWIDITCNYKLAELAYTYLKKGSKVLVIGVPSVNAYKNKNNEIISTLRISANELEFLSTKSNENDNNQSYTPQQQQQQSSNVNSLASDFIPF